MSDALAICGVTGVLQSMLNNVYAPLSTSLGGTVLVSAVAPDIVQSSVGTNSDASNRVNLFLHQVTPNAGWRNIGLPSLADDGGTRLKNQPLPLDLHYFLTVYGSSDGRAEALLGYAILMLHEFPVLSRNQIRTYLGNLSASDPVRASGLADQIELIKITPATMGREELAWIWTALKADYRPTYAFQVSVVLIQAQNPLVSALPVLSRTVHAQPNMPSMITQAAPPQSQPAACLGDTVTVSGTSLAGATGVVFSNPQLGILQTVTGLSNVGNSSFQFTVPNPSLPAPQFSPADLPAGVYLVSAQVAGASGTQTTNGVPLAIAPKITSPPFQPVAGGAVHLNITCSPYLRIGQQVSLLIGAQETVADVFSAPTNAPSFTFKSLQPTGGAKVPVRLRIDGVDSPSADVTKTPPVFSGPSIQVT